MIVHQTVDGRLATVAYLTADWQPADKDNYVLAKVEFENGDVVFLNAPDDAAHEAGSFNKHRQRARPAPVADSEGAHEAGAWSKRRAKQAAPYVVHVIQTGTPGGLSIKAEAAAWAKAIMVLDASEVLVRDLIERGLSGHTGTPANLARGLKAIPTANRVIDRIGRVRERAFKTAFRLLRSRVGDGKIQGQSLAVWAQAVAKYDLDVIRSAIMSGLLAGLDNMEIAAKVVGTMAMNGVDGTTQLTRHRITLLRHVGRKKKKA